MQGIRCELCIHGKPADVEQQRFCMRVGEGLSSPYELRVQKDFGCVFFERRSAIDKHCNNCKHWQHTDVALTVTWSGCSVRSYEHEVLMTRENHYCDKWEARV